MKTARDMACEFLRPISIVARVGAGVCWINDMPKPLHCRECNELTAAIEARDAEHRGAPTDPVEALLAAAREIRRVRDAQSAYTRELQSLAAEARKTGKSQSHRIPPRVYDYGDSIAALIEALEKFERAALGRTPETPR